MAKKRADVGRLVRVSPRFLRIEGLTCGLQEPWESNPCGGELLVTDCLPDGLRGEWRYDLFCNRCKRCDPNGWGRQAELIPAARQYFRALDGVGYRVRLMTDGAYLHSCEPGVPQDLNLQWIRDKARALVLSHKNAGLVAAMMIALTGELEIGVESTEVANG